MRLLIDGYNLLHASDVFGEGPGAGTLQAAREALLRYLASRLPEAERARTTIVFDAAGAPSGLPDQMAWEGLTVRFARGYADADTLIEHLIEACRGPKELTVVSSDHRVQRAARRRGAGYLDSDRWLRALPPPSVGRVDQDKPATTDAGESGFWIQAFDDPQLEQIQEEESAKPAPQLPRVVDRPADGDHTGPPAPPTAKKPRPASPHEPPEKPTFGEGLLDPFPPGYADDLAERLDPDGDSGQDRGGG